MKNHQMTQQSHCQVYALRSRKQGLKYLLMHVQSCFMHKSQKVETSQGPIDR